MRKEARIFQQKLYKDYINIYKLKDGDLDFNLINCQNDYAHKYFKYLQKNRDAMIYARLTNFNAYNLLVWQYKTEKAIEKYDKLNSKGELWEYEKHLLDFVKNNENYAEVLFDPESNTLHLVKAFTSLTSFV